jgi:enoyl-CoA hydratase
MSATAILSKASHVLLERRATLAIIVLNRPEALNALSLDMGREMARFLDALEKDATVACVAVKGAGERGLCAGGDIRTLYDSALRADGWPEVFWAEEYALNARIASFPKPYVAVMDGIVMGGGVGISAHARHRIVTERTKVAMPEVGIGLIPDVGGSWLLSRPRGEAGTCLALTGMTIGAGDAIHAGLAGSYIPSTKLDAVAEALARLPAGAGDGEVASLLAAFAEPPPPSRLEEQRAVIDGCLSFDTVEEIQAALVRSDAPFAKEILAAMLSKSPTSLKVTLKLLRLGRASKGLEECLEREYRAVLHATALAADMVEGIRAAVIDKDRNPKWCPGRLEDVAEKDVAAFLEKAPSRPIPFHKDEALT